MGIPFLLGQGQSCFKKKIARETEAGIRTAGGVGKCTFHTSVSKTHLADLTTNLVASQSKNAS